MKLQLNFGKPDNYAFFCPVSRVHLTRSNPVAVVDEVTHYIRRGLKSKAIIEIDEETTVQKATTKQSEPTKNSVVTEPSPIQEESTKSVKEEVEAVEAPKIESEAPAEEPKEESKPARKGKKGSK